MKVRVIKRLEGLSQHIKVGEILQADKCKHVKNAFNVARDGQFVEWAVPAEYLEEIL